MVIRGNNRKVVFAEADDYHVYFGWLKEGADSNVCRIHAYILMSNHVHLLVSAGETQNLSRLTQHVGRKYGPYFNQRGQSDKAYWNMDSVHVVLMGQ